MDWFLFLLTSCVLAIAAAIAVAATLAFRDRVADAPLSAEETASATARNAEWQDMQRRQWESHYGGGLLCATCYRPIQTMTDENDFICEEHGFVNAVRVRDGAVLAGNGVCGAPRILRMDARVAPYYGFTMVA